MPEPYGYCMITTLPRCRRKSLSRKDLGELGVLRVRSHRSDLDGRDAAKQTVALKPAPSPLTFYLKGVIFIHVSGEQTLFRGVICERGFAAPFFLEVYGKSK